MQYIPILNLYNLPVLIAAALNIGLILFIIARGSRQTIHHVFVGWNLTLAIWNVGAFGIYGATNESAAFFWSQFCCLGVVFIPATFLHLVLTLQNSITDRQRRFLIGCYGLGGLLLFLSLCWPHFLVTKVVPRFWGWGPSAGPGTRLMDPLIVISTIYSLILLWKSAQASLDVRRNQLLYVFWGALIAFLGGGINVLVIHGTNIYPFGNVLNIVYSLAIAYAIVSYQWMDIRLALRQSVVYGSLSVALTATYAVLALLIDRSLTANMGDGAWGAKLLALPPTLFVAPALKNRIQPWVDKHFFFEWECLKKNLQDLGVSLCASLDIQNIGEAVVRSGIHLLRIEESSVWLWDEAKRQLNCIALKGSEHRASSLFRPEWLQVSKARLLFTRDLEWRIAVDPVRNSELLPLCKWMKDHGAATLVPVWFQNQFLGIWLMGARKSGDMWPRDVTARFQGVAQQLALAIHNALAVKKLEEQRALLEKTRELAVMGTLATEMAHELTKPLTRILNSEARLQKKIQGTSRKHLTQIEKETLRASEMLESFAMLSPHLPLQRAVVLLADLLEEALQVVGVFDDPSIRVVRKIDPAVYASVNRGQIVQILSNLIQNAWQAMPDGGTLTLYLRALSNRVEIRIQDTGVGIPRESLERVFEAFFTTRQQQGGRGVGLTISRAMVERHGGTVRLVSPVSDDHGTCAFISLPIDPLEVSRET